MSDSSESTTLDRLAVEVGGVVRLAPRNKVDALAEFLNNQGALYDVFDAAASGKPLYKIARDHGISYFALSAIWQSNVPVLAQMREIALKARSQEDRDRARAVYRKARTEGRLEEDQKRYVDTGIKLGGEAADVLPPQPAAPAQVNVNIGLGLGAAMVGFHRQGRTIEQPKEPEPTLEDLL